MANIPTPAPLQNAQIDVVVPLGVGAIDTNQIPTGKDVIMETNHFRGIKRVRDAGSNDDVTDEEMTDAISRHHKIVAKYANQDVAHAWANAFFARLNHRMDQMEARMDQIEARMDQREARIDARMDQMEARIGQIDVRMERIEARMGRIEARMDRMDARVDAGHA